MTYCICHILQYASQHVFLAILTHNPLGSRRVVKSTEPQKEHRKMTLCIDSAMTEAEVVSPNCVHTTCDSMYFVRAVAVRTKSKKKKYGT